MDQLALRRRATPAASMPMPSSASVPGSGTVVPPGMPYSCTCDRPPPRPNTFTNCQLPEDTSEFSEYTNHSSGLLPVPNLKPIAIWLQVSHRLEENENVPVVPDC